MRAATSTATAITGAWNHMVASYDGVTMRLYLNGAQVAATTTSMTLLDHTGPFDIGARGSGSESFYGAIDEVAVYPAALSAARVLDHYNASLPQTPATTYTYYPIGTTADNPCTQAIEADDQGAALGSRTGPDPDGDGPAVARVEEFVYDPAGRVVAFRVGTGPWSCVTYDARGRQASRAIPAAGAEAAVTYTFSYAVGANPQISSVVCLTPLALDVSEEGLDPGLVGRGAGPAEVSDDRAQRQELLGAPGAHLGPVVGHGQQDRDLGIVAVERPLELAGFDALPQPLVVEGAGEEHLDLGGDSSVVTRVRSHLRDTTSITANATRLAALVCVMS